MTKIISPQLKAHFGEETTTLAMCWKITRTDGVVKAFTDHDQDIVFSSVTYVAVSGFTPTAIESKENMSVDNLDVEGILSPGYITSADLLAGLYDYAEVEIFVVNFENISQGRMILKTGHLGEVTIENNMFKAEIRGITQHLAQGTSQVYSPSCRAILGDSKCKVNLASFTVSETVSTVINNQTFTSAGLTEAAGYFTGGEIGWTSGLNNGLRMEVKEFSAAKVVLALPMPYTIAVSDGFDIIAGCDKTLDICKGKFSNIVNFRGEPFVPGMDQIGQTAGTIKREG